MAKSRKIFSPINVQIKLPIIVLIGLFLAAGLFGYLYYKGPSTTKSTALFGGFVTGLTLAIIQFLFGWAEYRATFKVQALGVKNILLHREDRAFYQELIENANEKIYVMGVTACRFMEHFADPSSDRADTKVLLEALARGTKVRILVPRSEFLEEEDDKTKASRAANNFESTAKFSENFEYRYFDHVSAHSIVVADENCIIGPVFPEVPSKHTPAIYFHSESEYAKKYLGYFDSEWIKANATH